MARTGTALLPLHSGQCPAWLFKRMKKMAGAIAEIIIEEYSQDELLRRLSHPCWFQAFGCLLGFDWHSSGLTVTTTAALKASLNHQDLGVKIFGGKGRTSRKTPQELETFGCYLNFPEKRTASLVKASKLSAKVDNSLLQDQFQLYHHSFVVTEQGHWAVVQQGMNNHSARRYHWLSDNVLDFVQEPHSGIITEKKQARTLDLTSKKSQQTRQVSLELVQEGCFHYFTQQRSLLDFVDVKTRKKKGRQRNQSEIKEKELVLSRNHFNLNLTKQSLQALKNAYEINPANYEELFSLQGLGPKTLRALALVSELVYGTDVSWQDPAKFSYAHGGKDGVPRPVDKQLMDDHTCFFKDLLDQASLGRKEKLEAFSRLKKFTSAQTG